MALNRQLANLPDAITTDTSLNVGIGGTPSGSYKLDVTGTGRFTGALTSLSVTTTATSSVAFYTGTYVSTTLGDGSFGTYSSRIRENTSYGLNIDLYDRTASTWRTPLSFNNTGGAATFSSSVGVAMAPDYGQVTILKNSTYNTESSAGLYITSNTNSVAGYTALAIGTDDTNNIAYIQSVARGVSYTTKKLLLNPNGGNVGIGTSSPYANLDLGASGSNNIILRNTGNAYNLGYIGNSSGRIDIGFSNSNSSLSPLPYLSVTSGGNIRVNSTTDINSRGVLLQVSGPETAQFYGYGNGYGIGLFMCPNSAATGTHTAIAFRSPANGDVGSITTTSSATLYNVTSDYRLKQDLKDYSGLNLITAIKTYDYEWKSDKTRMYGVLAHELSQLIPYAVTGEKDGKEMQGVDYSKLVPILIKAIQEQQSIITSLQEQINQIVATK